MNVVRLNFSHGTHAEHARVIAAVREQAAALQRPVAVLQDLSGPKIRIGEIPDGEITLRSGQPFTLTTRNVPGDEHKVSVSYPQLPRELKPDDPVLLSDGTVELEVVATSETEVRCMVVIGGRLSSHKGINLPTSSLSLPALTEKDRTDLLFGMAHGVDAVAVSFVRRAADIEEARKLMDAHEAHIPLIAKIEKHEALDNLDEIIASADGVMVARGDLGVEIPIETIPRMQKMIIQKAVTAARPVITATQMLRSMVDSPRPTRAEVTDVANAVLDGSDAVMLSEETAVGHYPTEAVRIMDRTLRDAETIFPHGIWLQTHAPKAGENTAAAVAYAACDLAERVNAAAIITCTQSGSTACQVARLRPAQPIVAPSPDPRTRRVLNLAWGVVPLALPAVHDSDELVQQAVHASVSAGIIQPGARVVVTAGVPLQTPGTTNFIKVATA